MSPDEFKIAGYSVIDWLAEYLREIENSPIKSQVAPGEIKAKLPKYPPKVGEAFGKILLDLDDVVMPGLVNWQHPNFFGYFPANSSPPAILGDLLSSGLGVQGMLWSTGPAITEIETQMLDWLVHLCGLPKKFLSTEAGGGVIQDSASSSTLCAILAARERVGGIPELTSMAAYISDQAHSSVEKDLLIAGIPENRICKIPTNERNEMDCIALKNTINENLQIGIKPFIIVATVGTTSTGAIDNVERIAGIAKKFNTWTHVDAAWAGSATVCPEHRNIIRGTDQVDSYVFNPHKWLLTNFDCSVLYVADSRPLNRALSITPEYLKNKDSDSGKVIDYKDWQIPLGRRFRSLKLWFVIRSYGSDGLRSYIRGHVDAAKWLENMLNDSGELALAAPRSLSLICFHHTAGNKATENLLKFLNESKLFFLTHTYIKGRYMIRVSIGGTYTRKDHLERLWKKIQEYLRGNANQ